MQTEGVQIIVTNLVLSDEMTDIACQGKSLSLKSCNSLSLFQPAKNQRNGTVHSLS
jgi:hypothetical protein